MQLHRLVEGMEGGKIRLVVCLRPCVDVEPTRFVHATVCVQLGFLGEASA
jgi:hypothetical protein